MKTFSASKAVLTATALLSLAGSAVAHSWVEYAYKIARNGTMIGEMGYPRGYLPRNSTDPPFADSIPQNILPESGNGFYSGHEILNKFKFEAKPEFPMLEAAPGDFVALMHLENGHTTLPENQPNKPKNRGTVYFYGTSEPKENEKLFDVHLLWNKDGTGGDGRGKLLATRNYDDGQCYQPNAGELAGQRASEFAAQGATLEQELACQSDLQLPKDLKVGSTYTIYWYWDWPDLNPEAIDIEATKGGLYPWAGTFMRGQKDPHGFTVDAIAKNESYSSVIDIKITKPNADSYGAKHENENHVQANGNQGLKWVDKQNIYSMAIKEQMESNFQVDVDNGQGNGDAPPTQTAAPSTAIPSTAAPSTTTPPPQKSSSGSITTVTVTTTVEPPVSLSTIYVTVPADQMTGAAPSVVQPSTMTVTSFTTRSASAPTSLAAKDPETPAGSTSTTVFTSFFTRSKTTDGPSTLQTRASASNAIPPANPESAPGSIPGGQFRETPVPAPSQPSNAGGVPNVSPFLRPRGSRIYRDF